MGHVDLFLVTRGLGKAFGEHTNGATRQQKESRNTNKPFYNTHVGQNNIYIKLHHGWKNAMAVLYTEIMLSLVTDLKGEKIGTRQY